MSHGDILGFSYNYVLEKISARIFYFNSQYVLLAFTSCSTSNIMYDTVILCHKLVSLVLVRLIAIISD